MTGDFKAGAYTLPLRVRTHIMGILNITPDSFSDGGRYLVPEKALQHALDMEREGADILDVGAQSTRPGFTPVSAKEEWARLEPVLAALKGKVRIPISVDTFYPEVARAALTLGADILNDVTGFSDPAMVSVAAESECGCVVMHAERGQAPPEAIVRVRRFLDGRIQEMAGAGIDRARICIDPGIGFGKSHEENLGVLRGVEALGSLDCAILVGASRKRVVARSCGNPSPADRLYGTIAAHTAAILYGADIIRVHDVAPHKQAAQVADAILGRKTNG